MRHIAYSTRCFKKNKLSIRNFLIFPCSGRRCCRRSPFEVGFRRRSGSPVLTVQEWRQSDSKILFQSSRYVDCCNRISDVPVVVPLLSVPLCGRISSSFLAAPNIDPKCVLNLLVVVAVVVIPYLVWCTIHLDDRNNFFKCDRHFPAYLMVLLPSWWHPNCLVVSVQERWQPISCDVPNMADSIVLLSISTF